MPYIRNKRTGETVFVPDQPQMPANPTFHLQAPKMQSDIANTQANTQRTQQQVQQDAALLPYQIQKAQADALAAQQATGLDKQKLANIRAAQAQIDRLQYLYNKGPGRTKGIQGVVDYLPTPQNSQFNTAGAGLGETGLAAFRVPGVGSQSDAELRAFIDANRPSASDFDERITEKLSNLQNRLDQTYQAYGIKRQPPKKFKGGPRTISFHDLPER